MKTRKDELQDLFLAVKKHLLGCGRNLSTSIFIATKVVNEAEKNKTTIKDIQVMRDIFLEGK
nr:MAG TPA: hypothetical protein [Caudoviricetes sp.]